MDTHTEYDDLIQRFVMWASDRRDIRAVAIQGSRARSEKPADPWADVDLWVWSTKPRRYLSDSRWLEAIGEPCLSYEEMDVPAGGEVRRAVFRGALEVDFAITSSHKMKVARALVRIDSRIPRLLPASLRAPLATLAAVLARGLDVVLDKDGDLSALAAKSVERPLGAPPSQQEFRDEVFRFWHGAVWAAKHLRRGELWRSRDMCDTRMKAHLLHMIEWHARATRGWSYDTWIEGRFLEEWADPRVVENLARAFAHYDTSDAWRALLETMDLFRWVAKETADGLGFSYPEDIDGEVSGWVETLHGGRGS